MGTRRSALLRLLLALLLSAAAAAAAADTADASGAVAALTTGRVDLDEAAKARKKHPPPDPSGAPPGYLPPIPDPCPQLVNATSGLANDMGLLAEVASGDARNATGVCAEWKLLRTCEAKYDTRLRIFQSSKDANTYAMAFRPTQMNPMGEAIHQERRMVNCTFLDGGCQGMVHDRFQQAFEELVATCWTDIAPLRGKTVLVTGHSLGGGFGVFASVKLWKDLGTIPAMIMGWAGPFIGDKAFNDAYQVELKEKMGDRWWQVETVMPRAGKRPMVDPTCSSYDLKRIYPLNATICGLYIPQQVNGSYGMHDLKNFRSALNGTDCTLP